MKGDRWFLCCVHSLECEGMGGEMGWDRYKKIP